jgi:TPR repeat protein
MELIHPIARLCQWRMSAVLASLSMAMVAATPCWGSTNRVAAALAKYPTVEQIARKWDKVSAEDIQRAAEAGDALAQFELGTRQMETAEAQFEVASQWMRRVINSGESVYAQAEGTWGKSPEEDIRKAAYAGDEGAMYMLGKLENQHSSTTRMGAVKWFEQAASNHLAVAQFSLGGFCYKFRGSSGGFTNALRWFHQAADQGHEGAQHMTALMLLAGQGQEPDLVKGLQWLRRAADQGCAKARCELADEYACGNGEPRDASENPVALLLLAGEAGRPEAWLALGERSRTGLGMPQDYFVAVGYYGRAVEGVATYPRTEASEHYQICCPTSPSDLVLARTGDIFSMVSRDDKIVPQHAVDDPVLAEILLLRIKALARNNVAAQMRLGQMRLKGNKLPRDLAWAYFFFRCAAKQGNLDAARECEKLRPQLSEKELQKTRQRFETIGMEDSP